MFNSGQIRGANARTLKLMLSRIQIKIFTIVSTVAALGLLQAVGRAATIPPGAPYPVAVSPASGSGPTQVMTFTFQDQRGFQDLGVLNVLINNVLDGRNACYLAFNQSQGMLYLVNDAGTDAGVMSLNTGQSLQNSQCRIDAVGSSASGSGNGFTLKLNATFSGPFAGDKVVYAAARDQAGNNSGWIPMGVWQVPGAPSSSLTVGGMSPASGNGQASPFHFVFNDAKGFQDLGVVNVLVNDALDGRQACYLAYSRPLNTLYLMNDAGTGELPGIALGGSGTVNNGQCTVSAAGSNASGGGNTLTLTLNMSFAPAFGGSRIFYSAARDVNGANNTGWHSVGSYSWQPATTPSGGSSRIEQNDPSITYSGTWYPNSESPNSGGSATTTNEKGARAAITFNGTGITWLGLTDPYCGLASVYLDGTLNTIDTYSPTTKYQQPLFSAHGLAPGQHTLSIEVLHVRDGNTSGSWVWIDGFEIDNGSGIVGGTTASAGRIEQNDPALSFTGGWFPHSSSMSSGGSTVSATDSGSRVTVEFTGTGIRWITYRDAYSGIANVYLDGSLKTKVDTYAPVDQVQSTGFDIGGLALGHHSLTIEATGTHNSQSGGSWVWVDAFDVR